MDFIWRVISSICVVAGAWIFGSWQFTLAAQQTHPQNPPISMLELEKSPQVPAQPVARPKEPAPAPKVKDTGNWIHSQLDPQQQKAFEDAISLLPLQMQPLVDHLSKKVRIDDDTTTCGQKGYSCASASTRCVLDHCEIYKVAIHLDPSAFRQDETSQFLILHELAHTVEYTGISQENLLRWRSFLNQPQEANIQEAFADSFAMWVMDYDQAPTVYQTKRVFEDAAFYNLLATTWAGR